MLTTFKQTILFEENLGFSLPLLNICNDSITMRESVTTKSTKGGKRVGFKRGFPSRREYFREVFAGVRVCRGGGLSISI